MKCPECPVCLMKKALLTDPEDVFVFGFTVSEACVVLAAEDGGRPRPSVDYFRFAACAAHRDLVSRGARGIMARVQLAAGGKR